MQINDHTFFLSMSGISERSAFSQITGTRSGYLARMRSASDFLFSNRWRSKDACEWSWRFKCSYKGGDRTWIPRLHVSPHREVRYRTIPNTTGKVFGWPRERKRGSIPHENACPILEESMIMWTRKYVLALNCWVETPQSTLCYLDAYLMDALPWMICSC